MSVERKSIFDEESNCWRVSRAERFGWLIDAEMYFAALRDSFGKAEHEILIIGWDIDSRTQLIRDRGHSDYPGPLAQTLEALVRDKPGLCVYVLSWDFSVVYLLERELLPARSFGWEDSDRLHFKLDSQHTLGASQHQKIVVIDGKLAFTGGIDLTKARWDTRQHAADDDRRETPDGRSYRPFHDVQAIVSGSPAADLRELFHERWKNATGETLPDLQPAAAGIETIWPDVARVRSEDVDVAIARTWIRPESSKDVHEVRQLYLDMIASARDYIYIENQYLTSPEITAALGDRLRDREPPEILIVMPASTSGWLEQATMDVLRNQAFDRLRQADSRGKLRIVSPVLDDLGDTSINVHAKIMVVDGRIGRIGSANLSQRSMGLDTECDLVVSDDDCARILAADLLAEHMGADIGDVADSLTDNGLFATVDRFNAGSRRFEALETSTDDLEDAVLRPMAKIADLEKPLLRSVENPESRNNTETMHTPASGWIFTAIVAAILGFWILLGIQGTENGFDLRALLDSLRKIAAHPLAPWAAVPAFVAGSLVVMPVTAMIALCGLLFEPWIAVLTATTGMLASTAVNHWIGMHFGNAISARIPNSVATRINGIAAASDAWSLAGLRLIPIAPFTVVNIVAGASGINLREFLLGSIIGMGPGIVLICLSVDRARAALSGEPVLEPWIIVAIAAAGAAIIGLRGWQQKSRKSDD
jgi:phosphatidylserine/phosphatidylglycerophosphate/cardiolipin synthase-like enzyme/membrane protein YqaA with SNARE-associated domain